MLKRLEVENFKGFREKFVFDLLHGDYRFNSDVVSGVFVKNALVYGKNGSGKTCLGLAMFDIISHLTDVEQMDPKYLYAYRNLDAEKSDLVKFRYVFDFDGVEVDYSYGKDAAKNLAYEKLLVDGERLVEWDYFAADASARFVNRDFVDALDVSLSDNSLSVVKYLYRNLPSDRIPLLTRMMRFVSGMLWYRSLSDGNTYAGLQNSNAGLEAEICKQGKVAEFQRFLEENGVRYRLTQKNVDGSPRIFVVFKNGETVFSNVASTGTKALQLFYYWSVSAFGSVSLLFIDEFDAFLHYESAAAIVRRLNKAGFQVILTSHNTYLMQNKLTRPDCCYIIAGGKVKCLSQCTDREIREAHNLEKLYQNGAFTK